MLPGPHDTSARDALLDEVVAAFLQAEAEGDEAEHQEWLARYPELSPELGEFFADRDCVRQWLSPFQAALHDTPLPHLVAAAPDEFSAAPPVFADYELLACLGQGGMGLVYKARQRSLRRLVALKMIRPDALASSAEVPRFRTEAELIAQLDHPGIVPVYEVGESDGRPYFTMKLIEGGSLAQRLSAAGDRLSAQEAARLVAAVARAVHHAHQRGILHRDLKPSNILLDFEGRPHVTDFGLARRLQTDSGLTQSQAIVGTPSYMAPEQTLGPKNAITTATDVHGLGAILYALLTGRPPFAGDSVLETLEQVRSSDPLPPRRLRSGVPRDLETICLKCLHKEPARRYASAMHLVEDLGRYLEGKTIQARPTHPVHRLVKWMRRRPALASLIAGTLVAAVVVAALTARYQRDLQRALMDAQRHADEAQRRKEEATANYRQARETIDRMLAHARDPKRGDVPRLVELRRAQQEEALTFLLSAAQQKGDEPEVLSDVAAARMLAAQLQHALGQPEAARANVIAARELLAGLAERFPDEPSYQSRLAYAWMELGTRHQANEEGAISIRHALAIYEAWHARGVEVSSGLSMAHHNLAVACESLNKPAEAEEHWRKALAIDEQLCQAHPEARAHRSALAKTQLSLSVFLQTSKERLAEATRLHDQAEANLEQLVREDPANLDSIHSLAQLRVNWAYVLLQAGRTPTALADLQKNERLLRPVLDREPHLVLLRDVLLRTHGVRATIQEQLGRYAEAVSDYEQVLALAPLSDRNDYRVTLAVLRVRAGDHAQAVADAEALARDLPNPAPWKSCYVLARTCSDAIRALEKDGTIEAAARAGLAERYAAAALRLLDRTRAAAGEAEWKKQEARLAIDFRPLVGREDYRQWLKTKQPARKP